MIALNMFDVNATNDSTNVAMASEKNQKHSKKKNCCDHGLSQAVTHGEKKVSETWNWNTSNCYYYETLVDPI